MERTLTLRVALTDDLSGVDALLARSYPRLLAPDYPPSVMVTALPVIARARPSLLASGRYYVVVDLAGRILGAGGWSLAAPATEGVSAGQQLAGTGHVRHLVTDPAALRKGIAAAIMAEVLGAARIAGVRRMECLSTRTAVPFYAAQGFVVMGAEVDVPLGPGIVFPAVPMQRQL